MLDALHFHDERQLRFLRQEEKDLIRVALGSSSQANLDEIQVIDADDGRMGSVTFQVNGSPKRVFGSELARLTYIDADRVPVSITLNADSDGEIFEIDFWKVDFSPLVAYPKSDQLRKGDP